jgi:hypothetical protein
VRALSQEDARRMQSSMPSGNLFPEQDLVGAIAWLGRVVPNDGPLVIVDVSDDSVRLEQGRHNDVAHALAPLCP